MMCKKPFVRTPTGLTRKQVIMSTDARTAVTPFPCGQCLHCKINKSREWSNRLMLEQMTSQDSHFVTLTYDDDHLPEKSHLEPSHLTKFIKRIRKYETDSKIRYFAVGEYGDNSWRPHYHLAMYSNRIMRTEKIESIWGKGYIQVGTLTPDSARYLTGYVTKKITKPYYQNLGERPPEFMRCSTHNGGLGHDAVKRIAKQIKKNKYFNPRVIREINVGRRTLPLGRYLTNLLSDELGVSEAQKKADLYEYQETLFKDNLTDDGKFLINLLEQNKPRRLSQVKKQKIYSKGRSL